MKYLGLDWGLKKIGLAISEGSLASPLGEVQVKSLSQAVDQVVKLVKTETVDKVILGLPEGGQSKEIVLKAQMALKTKGLMVETVDETLSTKEAISQMVELGLSKKRRKNDHSFSASIILQGYLDDQI